jgi:hypothetical protein
MANRRSSKPVESHRRKVLAGLRVDLTHPGGIEKNKQKSVLRDQE